MENLNFEIGKRVHLKESNLNGVVKEMVPDLCMVELDNGLIEAYYNRQLEII